MTFLYIGGEIDDPEIYIDLRKLNKANARRILCKGVRLNPLLCSQHGRGEEGEGGVAGESERRGT